MSAYVVSDEHIHALVAFAIAKQTTLYFQQQRIVAARDTATEIGQMLVNENFASCNARYRNETGEPHAYRFAPKRPLAESPLVILKLIACLDYQCCEHDGWQDSRGCHFLQALKDDAIRALPGYDAAPWGI